MSHSLRLSEFSNNSIWQKYDSEHAFCVHPRLLNAPNTLAAGGFAPDRTKEAYSASPAGFQRHRIATREGEDNMKMKVMIWEMKGRVRPPN